MEKPIQFIVSAALSKQDVQRQSGSSEYSYRFVLEGFKPLLSKLGTIVEVEDPTKASIDELYANNSKAGIDSIFLHFTAPHHHIPNLVCPTAHVFAWEYDTIPTEHWNRDGAQDWRAGLNHQNLQSFCPSTQHKLWGSPWVILLM